VTGFSADKAIWIFPPQNKFWDSEYHVHTVRHLAWEISSSQYNDRTGWYIGIREVPGSNLDWCTVYSDWIYSFSSVPPGKCQGSKFKGTKIFSFQILEYSVFITSFPSRLTLYIRAKNHLQKNAHAWTGIRPLTIWVCGRGKASSWAR
jgi:hypothetical protein